MKVRISYIQDDKSKISLEDKLKKKDSSEAKKDSKKKTSDVKGEDLISVQAKPKGKDIINNKINDFGIFNGKLIF